MVLLVVDTQKGIVDERLYAFETFVSNIKELIRTAREQGIEVVYVQHDRAASSWRAFCFSAELKLAGEGHFFLPALDVSAQSATPSLFGGDPRGVA